MAIDFTLSRYLPPGIYSNPIQGPQLAVNSSLPQAVGIVGLTVARETYTESIKFHDTDESDPLPYALSKKGIKKDTIVVRNIDSMVAYPGASTGNTTKYTVENLSGGEGHPTSVYGLRRNPDSSGGDNTGIGPTEIVEVSYEYTDENYYKARSFWDYRDVVSAYGEALVVTTDENGSPTWKINSELSLAAKFAFLNGAYQVVCVAVQPTAETALNKDYTTAMDKLKDNSSVAVVTSCRGVDAGVIRDVRQHIYQQSGSRFERRAILGFDKGTNSDARMGYAVYSDNLDVNNRIMLVSPSSFSHYSTELNTTITLGGQYMAAALAGMTVAMSFAMPLTHKYPVGWNGIDDTEENLSDGAKTNESSNGLAVVEYDRRKNIRVRHGVTTDPSDLISREWSITGQQDALVFRLRDYLDDANIIGQPIYSYTLVNVKASAEAALQSLVRDNLLVDYTGLSVRQLLTNPDVIEVSFGWKPAFPLNYVILTFGVNLTSGSLSVNSVTGNSKNYTSTTQITAPASTFTGDFGGSSNTLQSF